MSTGRASPGRLYAGMAMCAGAVVLIVLSAVLASERVRYLFLPVPLVTMGVLARRLREQG